MNRKPISSRFPLCENDLELLRQSKRSIIDSLRQSVKHYGSYKVSSNNFEIFMQRETIKQLEDYKEFFEKAQVIVNHHEHQTDKSLNETKMELTQIAQTYGKSTDPMSSYLFGQRLVDTYFQHIYKENNAVSEEEDVDDIMSNVSALSSNSGLELFSLKPVLKMSNNNHPEHYLRKLNDFKTFIHEIIDIKDEDKGLEQFLINVHFEKFSKLNNEGMKQREKRDFQKLIKTSFVEKYVLDGFDVLYDEISTAVNLNSATHLNTENPRWFDQFMALWKYDVYDDLKVGEEHFITLSESDYKFKIYSDPGLVAFLMNLNKFYDYLILLQPGRLEKYLFNDFYLDSEEEELANIMADFSQQKVFGRKSPKLIKFNEEINVRLFNVFDPVQVTIDSPSQRLSSDDEN